MWKSDILWSWVKLKNNDLTISKWSNTVYNLRFQFFLIRELKFQIQRKKQIIIKIVMRFKNFNLWDLIPKLSKLDSLSSSKALSSVQESDWLIPPELTIPESIPASEKLRDFLTSIFVVLPVFPVMVVSDTGSTENLFSMVIVAIIYIAVGWDKTRDGILSSRLDVDFCRFLVSCWEFEHCLADGRESPADLWHKYLRFGP